MSTWKERLWISGRTVFAYALLPNLPFLLAARFMHVQRPLVNLDYLVWGVACAWLPWPLALTGCFVLMSTDLLLSFSSIYYLDFADALSSLRNVANLSPWYSVSVGAACIGLVCILSLCITLLGKVRRNLVSVPLLVGLIVLLSLADTLNGSSVFSRNQAIALPVNVSGSTAVVSVRQLYNFAQELRHPAKIESVLSATAPLLRAQYPSTGASDSRENIVLIVEESLGLSTDARLTDSVLAPFRDVSISERYEVRFGAVPFHGATVAAEYRELCGAGLGLRLREAAPGALSGCLPAKLRDAGFQVEAIHGFTSRMFRRDRWYPKLGFDRYIAAEQFGNTLGRCGVAFEGVCDDQIAGFIGRQLRIPSATPRFVYWLTLNSHLPVETRAAQEDSLDCSAVSATKEFGDVCDLSHVLHRTNAAIAKLAADPDLPPTRFIIVGDHAPPFISDAKRALYSQSQVPYIELRPRVSASRRPEDRLAKDTRTP